GAAPRFPRRAPPAFQRALWPAIVQEHVQGAGCDEERADIEKDKEMSPLLSFTQRTCLVLSHPEDDTYRTQTPHPVQGKISHRIPGSRVERRPRERCGHKKR